MKTRIRDLRTQRGWTLKQLAGRLDTTPQTVQRLESGIMTMSTEWLARFAAAFGVRARDLLADPGYRRIEFLGALGRNGMLRLREDPTSLETFTVDVPAERPVAVRLEEPMGPYPRGSLLIGNRLEGRDLAAVHNYDALVALDDSTVLLRRLVHGNSGRFILVPFSSEADIRYDVAPLWIARLVMRIDYL